MSSPAPAAFTIDALDNDEPAAPAPAEVIDVDELSDSSMPSLVTLDDGPDDVPPNQAEPDVSPLLTAIAHQIALRLRSELRAVLGDFRFEALVGDATPFERIIALVSDLFRMRHVAASGGSPVRLPLELQVLLHYFRYTVHAVLGLHPVQLLDDTAILCFAMCDQEGLYFLHQLNIRRYPNHPADALHAELHSDHAADVAAAPEALNRIAAIADAGFNNLRSQDIQTRAQN
ncbi:hypothetical protein DFP72DRAFT_1117974 [Ephemerocybe angulata]|uniref:Uncharacterized protein n=1 Tax=Ephemerocybe angulata TaxID=980116 RepID=A0A8H6H8K9_9AGAR|nr:hypothetical protein DFP72DRAFT_1117974 [Tulosesus angulatus]